MSDPDFWNMEFPITSVTRADLVAAHIPRTIAEKLTDKHMQHIASKMADYYCQNGFWDDTKTATEYVVAHHTGEDDGLTGMEQSA